MHQIDRDELNVVYAIVKTGGRQEKVSVGSIVVTNRIEGEAGDTVELEPIMLVDVQAAMPVSDQRVTSPVPMEVDAVATGPDEHGEEEPRAVSIDRDATEPLEDPSVDPLRDPETPALVIGSLAPVPVKGSQAMLETEPKQMSAPELAPTSHDELEAGTTAVSGHAPAPEAGPPGTSPQPTSKKVEEKAKEEGKTPRKIIWIETLDTPATRREKYRRLKAEKQAMLQRAAAEAAAAERRAKGLPSPEPESAPVAGPSQSQKQRQADDAMDVESEEEEEQDVAVRRAGTAAGSRKKRAIDLEEEDDE